MTSIDDIPIQPDRQRKRPVGQIVSICISIVALMISAFSLWQSHKNSILQRELARPFLEIVSAEGNGSGKRANVSVNAKNVGHLTAIVTKIVVKASTFSGADPRAEGCYDNLDHPLAAEIEPGETENLGAIIYITKPPSICRDFRPFIAVAVTFAYRDTGGNSYIQTNDYVLVELSPK